MRKNVTIHLTMLIALFLAPGIILGSEQDDAATVAALDTQYQAAVKKNDYATMNKILSDDFILVIDGTGPVAHKADLIDDAKKGTTKYEHQEEIDHSQKVRVWGNTAVETAKLWIKPANAPGGTVWFSDTYIRTKSGWKYVLGLVPFKEQ